MKVSVYIAASLDGFIAREDGDVDWLHSEAHACDDKNEDCGYAAFMATVDTLVMGRKSFEKVLSFGDWPYTKPVMVLSSGAVDIPKNISNRVETTTLQPAELLSSLAEKGVKHVYLDGGKTIQGFLSAGLVDELIITRIPRLIGQGIPLFGALDKDVLLNHISTESFSGGMTQSKYQVVKLHDT